MLIKPNSSSNLRGLLRLAVVFLAFATAAFASDEQRVVEKADGAPAGPKNPALPTLWVAGDSTAANGNPNATGWGKLLPTYFDENEINVVNRARGGRSSKTFVTEGLWDQIVAQLKKDDVVLIQFGHNDAGTAVFTGKARSSLPGLGEETQAGTLPDGKAEVAHTYGWYMRKMIADTKAKGARPILISLTIRQRWENGKVERASGHYSEWTAKLAKTEGTAFIDLSSMLADKYDELGEEKVKAFFPKDYVHTGPEGADITAGFVVAGLKGLPTNPFGPLKPYSTKGETVEAAPFMVLDAPKSVAGGPARKPLPVPANPVLPTLFLIGDSTVRNGQGDGSNGQWGWGEPIVDLFDTKKINVVNRAVGGLSSRTYLTGGHWERVLEMIKPGDFVVMQFGHNDSSAINDNTRARGSIKGVGEESQEVDNSLTGKHETVHSYGWYLRKFIADARAKGATPVVCSPIPRKIWADGKIVRGTAFYAGWAEEVAKETGTFFVPLNEIIARRYDVLGADAVNGLFGDEHTHTNRPGAELNAVCVVSGLEALKGNPFGSFLTPEAAKIPPFSP